MHSPNIDAYIQENPLVLPEIKLLFVQTLFNVVDRGVKLCVFAEFEHFKMKVGLHFVGVLSMLV